MRATEPGGLAGVELEWDARAAVTVVLASAGYPESSSSGDVIAGLDARAGGRRGASTRAPRSRGGAIVTAGGRVLNVTALGDDVACRPGRRVCCRRHDRRSTAASCAATSRCTHERAAEIATQTAVEAEFDGMDVDAPRVGIVMGSKSDMPAMEAAAKELEERGIRHEVRVMSAHRDPDTVADYAKNAKMRGLRVIIAGAGLSAALPGVVAAHTELPVIGVPLTSSMSVAGGLDALLSIAQMPPGVPVACVGVDNAKNAAVLAARILDS